MHNCMQQLHEDIDCRRLFYLNGVVASYSRVEEELGRGAPGVARKREKGQQIHKWILRAHVQGSTKELDHAIKGFQ